MSLVSRRLLLAGAGSGAVGLAVPGSASADPVRLESGEAQLPVGPVTVVPSDSRYQDLLFRGYNKRLISKPEVVRVVGTTEQVVQAVNEAASAGKRVAVRSGSHCLDGLVDNPEVQVVTEASAPHAGRRGRSSSSGNWTRTSPVTSRCRMIILPR